MFSGLSFKNPGEIFVFSGLSFKNTGEIFVFSGLSFKNPGEICVNPKSMGDLWENSKFWEPPSESGRVGNYVMLTLIQRVVFTKYGCSFFP